MIGAMMTNKEAEKYVTQGVDVAEMKDKTGGLLVGAEGEAAFAISRRPAWHKLGTVLEGQDYMTSAEALKAAHLDNWDVKLTPLVAYVDGQVTEIPDLNAVSRLDPFNL